MKDKECCALSSCQLSVSCPGIHYYMICSLIAGCKGYFSGFFCVLFFFSSVFGAGHSNLILALSKNIQLFFLESVDLGIG